MSEKKKITCSLSQEQIWISTILIASIQNGVLSDITITDSFEPVMSHWVLIQACSQDIFSSGPLSLWSLL